MKNCLDCNKVISPEVELFMNKMALADKVTTGTYYCPSCQIKHNINLFDANKFSSAKQTKPSVEALFGIRSNETIIKVKAVTAENQTQLNKQITYALLKFLDYKELLPKGYLTKVNNKNICFETAYKMVNTIMATTSYTIRTNKTTKEVLIALIERKTTSFCPQMGQMCESSLYATSKCVDCLGVE